MAGGEQIGRIEVEVVANTAQHDAALKTSEKAAESFAQSAEKAGETVKSAGEKMVAGMKEAAHEVHGTAKAFEKFIAIPGMIAGVAAAFYELGRTIRETFDKLFEGTEEKLGKFYASIDKGTPEERLGKLNEQISKLNKEVEGSRDSKVSWVYNYLWGQGSPGDYEDQLKSLTAMQQDLQNRVIAERNRKEEDAVEAVRRKTRELAGEGMTEQEQAALATELKVAELRDRLAKTDQKALKDAIAEQIEAEYAARDERIRKLNEAEGQRQWEEEDRRLTEEENRTQELHREKAKMQAELLEGEKRIRFEYEEQIAELQRRLNRETDDARRKDLQDMMKLAAQQFGKALAAEVQPILDQFRALQADNANTVYSLNAVVREIRAIRGTL